MGRILNLVSIYFLLLVSYNFHEVYGNSEVDALYAFKKQLHDPNNVLQSWDRTLINPCTWYHVTCNNNNIVTRLDLGNANLSGKLVPQLGQLSNLQYLELYGNNITGEIPNAIGNLTSLVSLDLFSNRLEGHIPSSLGNLQRLRYLRLNNNALTGTIPYSLTTIATLEVLDLSNNRLSGYVPFKGSFRYFTPLSFSGNPMLRFPKDFYRGPPPFFHLAPAPTPMNT